METTLWTLDELGARVALALAENYDGQANGAPTLEMRPIDWTADDWPSLGDALWQ